VGRLLSYREFAQDAGKRIVFGVKGLPNGDMEIPAESFSSPPNPHQR
jgi:hypothetical protein